ncbi:MAG TPA: ribonuclease III [Firmicutes bacterium]|nr:ribonuclease III [Bacillota bacterium]
MEEKLPMLALAYIGDAVYELYIRTLLVYKGFTDVDLLHHKAVARVKAEAQARALDMLEPFLTDEEKDIVRRGRNAKGGRGPRRQGVIDYRYSTGFEALLGHLFLGGNIDRLTELLRKTEIREGS